jgi:ribosomal protein S27AE
VERHTVECLRCGTARSAAPRDAGECSRCGYVGWAPSVDLSEPIRRLLRERPLEQRRLHLVA